MSVYRPYKNYPEEDIALMIRDIEDALHGGFDTPNDHKQLAELESELEEREWQ